MAKSPKSQVRHKSETIWKNSSRSAVDRVKDFLGRGGHPLEFRVAAALNKAGYSTNQGLYVEQGDGDPLEIDVLGVLVSDKDNSVFVELIIECKVAPTPWVVFSNTALGGPWPDELFSKLAAAAFDELRTAGPTLYGRIGDSFGFGIKALKEPKERDLAYDAVSGVVARARLRAAVLSKYWPSLRVILRPLVVVDGAICDAH
jgi:hypothetical protein